MNEPANEQAIADWLRQHGARLRLRKNGCVHTIDFREATEPADDTVLAEVAKLSKPVELQLTGSAVTDDGLSNLAETSSLTTLDLTATAITDAGLPHLARHKQLKLLMLSGTQVTREGVAALRKTMINTRIVFS